MFLLTRKNVIASVAVLVGMVGLSYLVAAPLGDAAAVEFAADGKLKLPIGYRKWVYVGGSVTPNDMNGGEALFPEFHSVYIDPGSLAHYEKTGEYRDGTVMVKELASVGGKEETSGKGYFMGDFLSLEVSIKDSQRFKNEPGSWAYFTFDYKRPLEKEVAAHATASCNKCHQENADKDFVFSQDYPVLRLGSACEVKSYSGSRMAHHFDTSALAKNCEAPVEQP